MNNQIEYKEKTKLLSEDGTLLAKGWARRNVFEYERKNAKPRGRLKEWDFYQVSNGEYMIQISFFNITLASAASACLVDIKNGKVIANTSCIVPFTRRKYLPPMKGDVSNFFRFEKGGTVLEFDTNLNKGVRKITFEGKCKGKPIKYAFKMDIMKDLENITIVTPFKDMPTRFFMTTKQNSMPCEGSIVWGDKEWKFDKSDTFAVLDWGRGVWPHNNVWYWGNGTTRIKDAEGKEHLFGFEITWKIGDESNSTETCLFYDGKAHKIGAVDVKQFPGDKGWNEPWEFVGEDGRFNLTMKPFFDYHTGIMLGKLVGMEAHQVHGLWSGDVTLDDGTKLEIHDMYAFCEYVRNAW